jgi:hypothetical protein
MDAIFRRAPHAERVALCAATARLLPRALRQRSWMTREQNARRHAKSRTSRRSDP